MKVKNRSVSVTGYTIPDLHIRRRFLPGEIKDISEEELQQLIYQPGGKYLLENYLQVQKNDIAKLNVEQPEREYFYTDDNIKRIMLSGSEDEFLDMLDFAPAGVIDMIKDYSVKLPLTNTNKIEALRKKTGFNASKALEHTRSVQEDIQNGGETASAPTVAATGERKRRVEDKYQIIED